jgi:hypothetical protein
MFRLISGLLAGSRLSHAKVWGGLNDRKRRNALRLT